MIVTPSEFGMTPRAIRNTLQLLTISCHEIRNIINMIDNSVTDCFSAIDPKTFSGMKYALMIYEVFLCGDGFPFTRNAQIDAACADLHQTWARLVQSVCKHIPEKKVARRFSTAWSTATEELQAILERSKTKSPKSEKHYGEFISALDAASKALSTLKQKHEKNIKMLHQIYRATVYGENPTDAQFAGDVRRQQVRYGADLYRPTSKHVKGVSSYTAAEKAILAPQFKGVEGAYSLAEKKTLARAIVREYRSPRDDFAT